MSAYEVVNRIKNDISSLEIAAIDLLQNEYNMRLFEGTVRAFSPVLSLCKTLSDDLGRFTGLCREVMDGVEDDDKDIPAYLKKEALKYEKMWYPEK